MNEAGDRALVLRYSARAAAESDGEVKPERRQFGRLRSAEAAPPAATVLDGRPLLRIPPPPGPPVPDAPLPEVVPFDSTKTFVGPNGTYYDERWRWMEWRGRNRSWNWSAALTFGGWLAYRRLYASATVYLGWLGVLALMLRHGVSLGILALAQFAVAVGIGVYGNRLYQARFRRAAFAVAQQHEEHAARVEALAGAGGVDRRAPWLMALAAIGLVGLLIGLDG
jgi:hypothetical protein